MHILLQLTIPTQSSGLGSGLTYSTVTLSPSRQRHVEIQSSATVGFGVPDGRPAGVPVEVGFGVGGGVATVGVPSLVGLGVGGGVGGGVGTGVAGTGVGEYVM